VLWGRNDQILEPKYADQFMEVLPNAELQWLEGCGHCGHLEKPRETADAILRFLRAEGARGLTSSEEEGGGAGAAARAGVAARGGGA
jgi:hypothetical protein